MENGKVEMICDIIKEESKDTDPKRHLIIRSVIERLKEDELTNEIVNNYREIKQRIMNNGNGKWPWDIRREDYELSVLRGVYLSVGGNKMDL